MFSSRRRRPVHLHPLREREVAVADDEGHAEPGVQGFLHLLPQEAAEPPDRHRGESPCPARPHPAHPRPPHRRFTHLKVSRPLHPLPLRPDLLTSALPTLTSSTQAPPSPPYPKGPHRVSVHSPSSLQPHLPWPHPPRLSGPGPSHIQKARPHNCPRQTVCIVQDFGFYRWNVKME